MIDNQCNCGEIVNSSDWLECAGQCPSCSIETTVNPTLEDMVEGWVCIKPSCNRETSEHDRVVHAGYCRPHFYQNRRVNNNLHPRGPLRC